MLSFFYDKNLPASTKYADHLKSYDYATCPNSTSPPAVYNSKFRQGGHKRCNLPLYRLAAGDLMPTGGIPAKIEYSSARGKGTFAVNSEVKDNQNGTGPLSSQSF